MRNRLSGVSFGLASAAAVFLLVWPVYSGFDGERPTHSTLLHVNGPWVIVPVIFPALVAFVPLVFPGKWSRILAAVLVGAFALISGFSIGMFYLPAAIVMLIAACRGDSPAY